MRKTILIRVVLDEGEFVEGQVSVGGEVMDLEEDALDLTVGEVAGLDQEDEDDDFRFLFDNSTTLDPDVAESILADDDEPDEEVTVRVIEREEQDD